ncbi:undecaprenyl-phosphate alpha-N-acetylglucosaminyl 1-phosphate transferase [Pedobacter mendelii]|uniref:Undecaprenyl-phosphate alpha-N-acetylglucosaminyl 1-phosphate transferase n=2 Tax=Pedobacter mendelii TaxID=1908240 RepID=A0ABQ2BM85_9SPHI|nr:undecaprenyl-phosphate alpha-N-acetylglucosaminyl 1-phosphate transferase [Pedobacter mendelii]
MACVIVVSSLPSVMHTSIKYNLFDKNDMYRKTHKRNISRLGGISIVASFTITTLLFSTLIKFEEANFLITSCIILAALGLKDDVYGSNTRTKLILQLVVAFILVFFGGFKLTSLYGVLGIWDMPLLWGGIFSIILIIFLNNAFNLIDGIDGLAGTIGIVTSLIFGIFFSLMHQVTYAFIAFSLVGSIAGFLKYNWYPAKIFMGDTGALIIGLVTAALAIKFIELNKFGTVSNPFIRSAPAIAVSILIVPIFDSLRIFTVRVLKGKSPFMGDRNHIHHRLERLGLKPPLIMLVTAGLNLCMVTMTILMRDLGNFFLISFLIGLCVLFDLMLFYNLRKIGK